MDRKRIREEVIEILCNKLHNLPPPSAEEEFNYEHQALVPDITKDPLDIAEVAMDLEDAFGVNFEETLPGDPGMETIGKVVEYLDMRINSPPPPMAHGHSAGHGHGHSHAAPAKGHAAPAKGKNGRKG